jgi:hypothetical protein
MQQNTLSLTSPSRTYYVSEYDPQSDRSKGDTKGIADGEEEGYIDGNGNGPPEG